MDNDVYKIRQKKNEMKNRVSIAKIMSIVDEINKANKRDDVSDREFLFIITDFTRRLIAHKMSPFDKENLSQSVTYTLTLGLFPMLRKKGLELKISFDENGNSILKGELNTNEEKTSIYIGPSPYPFKAPVGDEAFCIVYDTEDIIKGCRKTVECHTGEFTYRHYENNSWIDGKLCLGYRDPDTNTYNNSAATFNTVLHDTGIRDKYRTISNCEISVNGPLKYKDGWTKEETKNFKDKFFNTNLIDIIGRIPLFTVRGYNADWRSIIIDKTKYFTDYLSLDKVLDVYESDTYSSTLDDHYVIIEASDGKETISKIVEYKDDKLFAKYGMPMASDVAKFIGKENSDLVKAIFGDKAPLSYKITNAVILHSHSNEQYNLVKEKEILRENPYYYNNKLFYYNSEELEKWLEKEKKHSVIVEISNGERTLSKTLKYDDLDEFYDEGLPLAILLSNDDEDVKKKFIKLLFSGTDNLDTYKAKKVKITDGNLENEIPMAYALSIREMYEQAKEREKARNNRSNEEIIKEVEACIKASNINPDFGVIVDLTDDDIVIKMNGEENTKTYKYPDDNHSKFEVGQVITLGHISESPYRKVCPMGDLKEEQKDYVEETTKGK